MNPVPNILVAGIGNIFLGDDGFGVEVIRRLSERQTPAGVEVRDFGIRGFDLTYALLRGYDATVLVDATPRGGTPGTLYVIEPASPLPQGEGGVVLETHGMNPVRVLELARSMGAKLGTLRVVGCEPAPLENEEGFLGLSAAVQSVVDPAVEMVLELVQELREQRHA